MQITETKIKVSELCQDYTDDGDGGVYGYDGRLTIRPSFQREFCYTDKQHDAEKCKIKCGEAHFKSLGNEVEFRSVDMDKFTKVMDCCI